MDKLSFCHSQPGQRPAWPLGDNWYLVGAERAWRLDENAPQGEKHYFMVMKPAKPYWKVGLFTPEKGDAIAMWLTRLGYSVKPDFRAFLARSTSADLPIGMLQFAVGPKGAGAMKAYHSTDERGDNLYYFPSAWQALNTLYPGMSDPIAWSAPIEGLATRGKGWELYTQAEHIKTTPFHHMPHKTLHNAFTMLGATCRQYSLSDDGTRTWYYTNMTDTIDPKTFLTLLDLATPTCHKQMDKVRQATAQGAIIGDLIVQSPKKNVFHPVADLLWPINNTIVFAP